MCKSALWVLPIVALALAIVPASAQNPDDYIGDPYTLGTCPVSGESFGSMGDPVLINYEGRDVRFCCAGCKPRFEADPAKYIAKIDAQIIEAQTPNYALTSDVVTGEALPEGDAVIDIVFNNRLVRLGSQKSAQKFYHDPEQYIAKLDEAVIAAQVDSYPFDVCVVSGDKLTEKGEPIQRVYGSQLVQFCCAGCVNVFWKSPSKYLSMIEKGEIPEGAHDEGSDHK